MTPLPVDNAEPGTLPLAQAANSTVQARGSIGEALSSTFDVRSHADEVAGRGGDGTETRKADTKASPLMLPGGGGGGRCETIPGFGK